MQQSRSTYHRFEMSDSAHALLAPELSSLYEEHVNLPTRSAQVHLTHHTSNEGLHVFLHTAATDEFTSILLLEQYRPPTSPDYSH